MATVTELVDMIAEDTGLSSGSERGIILRRLNHAYQQLATQMLLDPYGVEVDFGGDGPPMVSISANLAGFVALNRIYCYQASSEPYELVRRARRYGGSMPGDGTTGKKPADYYLQGDTIYIGHDGGSYTLDFEYIACPTLVEHAAEEGSFTETTPGQLTAAWHERLLGSLTVVKLLERYEGREQDAAYHRGLYNEAAAERRYMLTRQQGKDLPQRGHQHFTTHRPLGAR